MKKERKGKANKMELQALIINNNRLEISDIQSSVDKLETTLDKSQYKKGTITFNSGKRFVTSIRINDLLIVDYHNNELKEMIILQKLGYEKGELLLIDSEGNQIDAMDKLNLLFMIFGSDMKQVSLNSEVFTPRIRVEDYTNFNCYLSNNETAKLVYSTGTDEEHYTYDLI